MLRYLSGRGAGLKLIYHSHYLSSNGGHMFRYSLADINAEVSSDGSWLRISRVCLSQHHPACLHHTLTFPHLKTEQLGVFNHMDLQLFSQQQMSDTVTSRLTSGSNPSAATGAWSDIHAEIAPFRSLLSMFIRWSLLLRCFHYLRSLGFSRTKWSCQVNVQCYIFM